MKYIRTKDGITTDKMYGQALDICALTYENAQKGDLKIIAQADTIEELCDGFYLEDDNKNLLMRFYHYWWGGNNFSCDLGYFVINREDFKSLGIDFYGFIETNKGLIYVAKMNDKGELELL